MGFSGRGCAKDTDGPSTYRPVQKTRTGSLLSGELQTGKAQVGQTLVCRLTGRHYPLVTPRSHAMVRCGPRGNQAFVNLARRVLISGRNIVIKITNITRSTQITQQKYSFAKEPYLYLNEAVK